jgi:hypothetical protein
MYPVAGTVPTPGLMVTVSAPLTSHIIVAGSPGEMTGGFTSKEITAGRLPVPVFGSYTGYGGYTGAEDEYAGYVETLTFTVCVITPAEPAAVNM